MLKSSSGTGHLNLACFLLFLGLVFWANVAFSGTIVKYLPGYDGELPFTLETGYISVGPAEMFYYFIESEGNPKEDPLLLWYSGGPGCSAFNGLIYEIGPLEFNISDYEGGLPSLAYYPYSWTKSASILFLDAPVGTGFSYSITEDGWSMSDTSTGYQVYQFLKKWLAEHPQYIKLQLFVGADSYSGISATLAIQHILDGNGYGAEPHLNLKGYILGCPRIDGQIQENSKVIFAHRLALISDELYRAAKNACDSDYYGVTSADSGCYATLALIKKCYKDINKNDILEPKCTYASPNPIEESARRSLRGTTAADLIMPPSRTAEKWCHNFNYSLAYVWANDANVQAALNVTAKTVRDWKRCNKSLDYDYDITSVIDYHKNFSTKGLQALVYNGDHDFTIPNVGTQQWIKELDLTIVNDWRPWLVDGQVAGISVYFFTKAIMKVIYLKILIAVNFTFSGLGINKTFMGMQGAGHSPQEYKRRECYDMFDRFIHYWPL
ncbi:serine carboxypeptidase, putative [Ricinus communis]|uniref:Serine carboxypeptidase, putative n=1 Tax=Ricinus communis TaxID=3988 RepID=B9S816_RICCO|nr:serine carboxypeptidase, putative [Ricinus communis]